MSCSFHQFTTKLNQTSPYHAVLTITSPCLHSNPKILQYISPSNILGVHMHRESFVRARCIYRFGQRPSLRWQSVLLESLQTSVRCCSLCLGAKYHSLTIAVLSLYSACAFAAIFSVARCLVHSPGYSESTFLKLLLLLHCVL